MEVMILNAVRLSNLLAEYKIVGSEKEAKQLMRDGKVKINGKKFALDFMINARDYMERPFILEVNGTVIPITFV